MKAYATLHLGGFTLQTGEGYLVMVERRPRHVQKRSQRAGVLARLLRLAVGPFFGEPFLKTGVEIRVKGE